MLIGFGYDLWRGGWNGTAFLFQVQEFHWWFSDGCFISECLVREISNFFVYWEELWDQYIFCVYLVCISDRRLLSLAILILCGGFSQRIQYLVKYMKTYIRTGERKAYYRNGTAWENIHFTVPVFMSVMLYAGGMY